MIKDLCFSKWCIKVFSASTSDAAIQVLLHVSAASHYSRQFTGMLKNGKVNKRIFSENNSIIYDIQDQYRSVINAFINIITHLGYLFSAIKICRSLNFPYHQTTTHNIYVYIHMILCSCPLLSVIGSVNFSHQLKYTVQIHDFLNIVDFYIPISFNIKHLQKISSTVHNTFINL